MAAKDELSFDDLTKVTPSSDTDEDDVPTIKLEPGESIVAEIRHIERNVGQYDNDVLHLTRADGSLCKMWSNATIKRALSEAGVGAGDTIGVRKEETTYSYTDDEGEEREAYGFEVGVMD